MRVAVVGGGVAGIIAAHIIQRSHQVTLIERNPYVGGHTHTVTIPDGPDAGTPVDTGFIVLNDRTYPLLNRFLGELGVQTRPSDMSFSYFDEASQFQYASRNFDSLFAQRRRLADPGHWAMLAEILLFNRMVLDRLKKGMPPTLTLGQFLARFRFSDRFKIRYLYPMVAAIWSAPDLAVERFPMLTFAHFFSNHGLLQIRNQPQWYYVAGGSHTYVKAFLERFRGEVVTRAGLVSIRRGDEGVFLKNADGRETPFDRVVVATHADEALRLLADPTDDERRLLGAWRYSANDTVLHTDRGWMPSNRRAWASWNVVRARRAGAASPVTLTYHMNRLQQLATRTDYLVTLNPFRPIAEETIVARMTYTHPVLTRESLMTQDALGGLNGVRHTYYCGSYFGYGFHEDAVRSGVQAAKALGVNHEF
jgi:predicted NAD/FAD-binding protein